MKLNNHKFKMLTRVTSMVLVVLMIFSMADFASMIGYAATQTTTEEVQLEAPVQTMSATTSTASPSVNYNDGNHHHTFACYEQWQKVCGYENGELDENGQKHYHTFDCFTHSGSLICGKQEGTPEHEHTSACEVVAEVYICGHEGHEHNEKCIDPDYGKTPARYVYYLNFDPNGGDGGPTRQVQESNNTSATFTIPDGKPTRSGYRCTGWLDKETNTVYHTGDTIIVTEECPDVRLYAVWEYGEEEIVDTDLPQASGSEVRYYCNKEEHIHTSECVYKVYVCGEEEEPVVKEPPARKPQRAPQAVAATQSASVKWIGVEGTSTGTVISGDTLSTSCLASDSEFLIEFSFTAIKTYAAAQLKLYLPSIYYRGTTRPIGGPHYTSLSANNPVVIAAGWSLRETTLSPYSATVLSGFYYDETQNWHSVPGYLSGENLMTKYNRYLYNTEVIPEGSHVTVQFKYFGPISLYSLNNSEVRVPYTFKLRDNDNDLGNVTTLYFSYKGGTFFVDSLKQHTGIKEYSTFSATDRVYYWSPLLEKRYGVSKESFASEVTNGEYIYVEIPFLVNITNGKSLCNYKHIYTLDASLVSSLPSAALVGTYLTANVDDTQSIYAGYCSRVNNGEKFIMRTFTTDGGGLYDPLLLCLIKVRRDEALAGDVNNTITVTGTLTFSAHSDEPLCPLKDFSVSATFTHNSPENAVTYHGALYGAKWSGNSHTDTEDGADIRSWDISVNCGIRRKFDVAATFDFTPPSTIVDNVTGEHEADPTEFVLSLDYFYNCNQLTPVLAPVDTFRYESISIRRISDSGYSVKGHPTTVIEGYFDGSWHTLSATEDSYGYESDDPNLTRSEAIRLRAIDVRERCLYSVTAGVSIGKSDFYTAKSQPIGVLWLGISGLTKSGVRLLTETQGYTGTSSVSVAERDKHVHDIPNGRYMYRRPLRLRVVREETTSDRSTYLVFRDSQGISIPTNGQGLGAAREVELLSSVGICTGAETSEEYMAVCKQLRDVGERNLLTADSAIFTFYLPNYLEYIRCTLPSIRDNIDRGDYYVNTYEESKYTHGATAYSRISRQSLVTGGSGMTARTLSCEENYDGLGTTRVKIEIARNPDGGWQNIDSHTTGHDIGDFGFAFQAVCAVNGELRAGQDINIPMRVEFVQDGSIITTDTGENAYTSSKYLHPLSHDTTSVAWSQRGSNYAVETGISFTVPTNTFAGLTNSSLRIKAASDYGYSIETSGEEGDVFALRASYKNTTGEATNVVTYVPLNDNPSVKFTGVDMSRTSNSPDIYVSTQQVSLDNWVSSGWGRDNVLADDGVFIKINPLTYTEWNSVTAVAFDYHSTTFSEGQSTDAYLSIKLVDKCPPTSNSVYKTKIYFSDTHSGGDTRTSYGNEVRIRLVSTYTTPLTLQKRVGDRIYVSTDATTEISRFQPTTPTETPSTSKGTAQYVYEYSLEGETPLYNDTILISDMFESVQGSEFKGTPKYIQFYSKLKNADKELNSSISSDLLNIRMRVYYTTVQDAKPMFMKDDGKVYLYKDSGWTQLVYWSPATRTLTGSGYLSRNPHKELPEGTTGLTFVIYSEYAKQESEGSTLTDLDSTDCFANKWDFAQHTGTDIAEYHTSLVDRLEIIVGMEADLSNVSGKSGELTAKNQASLEYVSGSVLEQLKSNITEYTVNFEEASGLDHELPDSGGSGMIPYIYLSAATLLTTATILTYRRKRKYRNG